MWSSETECRSLCGSSPTFGPSVEDQTTIVTADGAEAVLLNIVRQPDANTVAVWWTVPARTGRLRPTLPPGTDSASSTTNPCSSAKRWAASATRCFIGAALAVIVLLLFLGNVRATLVTAAIIPATVLVTFLLMRLAGLTLNLMTLGALRRGDRAGDR